MSNRGGWGVDPAFGESCLRLREHRDLLVYIAGRERRGEVVKSRDIHDDLKKSRATTMRQLNALAEEGLLEIEGEAATVRTIHLLEEGWKMANRCGSPVLGEIPAGLLRVPTETDGRDMEGGQIYLSTWDEELPPTEDFGILVVKGDSMIGEHIQPGDRVQIELHVPLHMVEDGEICAVSVGDECEATLKYVFRDEDGEMVTLRAANDRYKDIRVHSSDVRITGRVCGLVRIFPRGRK